MGAYPETTDGPEIGNAPGAPSYRSSLQLFLLSSVVPQFGTADPAVGKFADD